MEKFDTYFLMGLEDVARYAREKLDLFAPDAELTASEIGDGNLNYVFRVTDGERSVIIKQAGHTARISEDFKLSTDRIRIEAEALKIEGNLVPALVPEVYLFDPVMGCCAMEDLKRFAIMRGTLLEGAVYPHFAEQITTFLAETLIRTSDVVLSHRDKKQMQASFTNPELCEITEDLVYTEPFYDNFKRNSLTPGNEEWTTRLLDDEALRVEIAKLKFDFMTRAQALLHGDLHTGSIFITAEELRVIDPEFAFYGPMGYDIGNVIANLTFAFARATANGDEAQARWIEETIGQIVDLFKEKAVRIWNKDVTEMTAKPAAFRDWYLSEVIRDTAGVAGLELIRRIVGLAKVADITTIDGEARLRAERLCLKAAKRLIMERDHFENGSDFRRNLNDALQTMKEETV
ncbi:S-methyl-5-thioribose kinase [Exiguobacterium flavidum]|uniref:S-methyl-5-thioribose kinase n=1 Tax=Exiguobacterium flavidum TaxID=2184695 RepID=UPI000DF865EC|nr:S-methyl-5-thioribose kinase [Exiguobacterium flavidum]